MTMKYSMARVFTLFIVYFVLAVEKPIVFADDLPRIINLSAVGEIGGNSTIICTVFPENVEMTWLFRGKPLVEIDRIKMYNETRSLSKDADGNQILFKEFKVSIDNTTSSEAGNYTCQVKYKDKIKSSYKSLDLSFPAQLVNKSDTLRKLLGENATLTCVFKVYENREVRWTKVGGSSDVVKSIPKDLKHVTSTYVIHNIKRTNNGTYLCLILDTVSNQTVNGSIDVLVVTEPQVQIETARPIGAHKIYLTWHANNGNLPITEYRLSYRESNSSNDGFIYWLKRIDGNSTSAVIDQLKPSNAYLLQLEAYNEKGWSSPHKFKQIVTTAEKDINFVPNITINGFSATSVTIGWAAPPENMTTEITYYELEAQKENVSGVINTYHPCDNGNLPYMFNHLEPYSTYYFRVRACPHKDHCWNWTNWMKAMTLDGIPGKPENVSISCYEDDVNTRHLNLSWRPPLKPNAEIKGYEIELTGKFTYIDHRGVRCDDTWGPRSMFVTNVTARFDDLKPNMNYTVRLSAVTRTRRRGHEQVRWCITEPGPPDMPPRPTWRKFFHNNYYLFQVDIPRVSERNGPIYCYRVHMVRLHNKDWRSLPLPENILSVTYDEAHDPLDPKDGAYITDIFTNKDYPPDSKLVMGDGKAMFAKDLPAICRKKPVSRAVLTEITSTTSTVMTTTEDIESELKPTTASSQPSNRSRRALYLMDYEKVRDKRNPAEDDLNSSNNLEEREHNYTAPNIGDSLLKDDAIVLKDDKLDPNSNYTMFVEVIAQVSKKSGSKNSVYSDYLNPLVPAASPPIARPINPIELALQITCGILAVVLLALVILCVMHTRRTRKMPPNAVEMNSLQATLRSLYQGLRGGRVPLVSSAPPDLPPIARDALAAAYAERQADSDYGFQQEFEMLPDCFADRTTYASEARENQPKNRYPDIKAYDQTRVRLSQIDSIVGSDYINANYVMGYKEPKKFICAQGPTDTTVNDFWRMIWEQGLELIVMLTNLEEYSKVKCSKYWPDEVRGLKQFGSITVQHVSEKRYSDYIVRELKITKQPTTAEGQPIIENNGISKRNGEGKDSPAGSAPTSPRDVKDSIGLNGTGPAERLVRQYHFLVWKDFAAPEYPHSILKFIKRVDEAWSQLMGRPVVVHCSAGVGRTGTLVALDYLLQQLRTENQVSVFNTIAELRRQRNFLVQSLKQYVFVYRALVEYAHYGDTEIAASRLKVSVDRLRNTPEGADKCLMEEEFERMISCPITECVKSCAVGAAEELRSRNRSDECLPYDRNRVILTPIPNKEFSTYINASFIEAYDNSEGFIITQDPLPCTIADFWRMVSDHNVSTIVMLSELGDGERKCPRYWDDAVAQYEHMSVQYEHSESCPYYTRREFRLTNTKTGEVTCVRQLQYHGWPTVAGQVPEVTRGLAEVADAADPVARLASAESTQGPMLVHCHLGTERSSMFVALCVLVCQLRVERRVDVGCVARKVRTQRAHTIDTFLQYEFLHRAILNYAELHNLLDDS